MDAETLSATATPGPSPLAATTGGADDDKGSPQATSGAALLACGGPGPGTGPGLFFFLLLAVSSPLGGGAFVALAAAASAEAEALSLPAGGAATATDDALPAWGGADGRLAKGTLEPLGGGSGRRPI